LVALGLSSQSSNAKGADVLAPFAL